MPLSVIFRNGDSQDLELTAYDLGPLDKPPFKYSLRAKGGTSDPFIVHPKLDGRGDVDWLVRSKEDSSIWNRSSSPVQVTKVEQIVDVKL